jgi:hypothetical protein
LALQAQAQLVNYDSGPLLAYSCRMTIASTIDDRGVVTIFHDVVMMSLILVFLNVVWFMSL